MSLRDKKFTQREAEFCYQMIIKKGNKTQAAIAAGYKENSAAQYAQKLLRKDYILERIEQLQQKQYEKLEITVDRIKSELAAVAFLDIGEAFHEDGTLKEIQDMPEQVRRAIGGMTITVTRNQKETTEYETKNVKIIDKIKPLELLGKELGMFVERTADVSDVVTQADLKARLESEKSRK